MLRLKSMMYWLLLLSLAVPLGNAWAKQPKFDINAVSEISLDVLRVEACARKKGCVVASGPTQLNLLDLADGNIDFANQVLLPERTKELRLVLGENNTITVNNESFPLIVPSGQRSGLKLKGKKAFGKEGGFLSDLTLKLNLQKQLVVKRGKNGSKGSGKGNRKGKNSFAYSYKLKPVIKVETAEITPLTDEIAAVVAMPDEDSEIRIGEKFSLFIPAGAVAAPMVISVKETKYTVEVMDEETGEVVEKPALSSKYELSPDGAEFGEPLEITIPYYPDMLLSEVSEYDLAVYLDGEKISTDIDTVSKFAVADVWHFTSGDVRYEGMQTFETQMPIENLESDNFGWKFMSDDGNIFHPGSDLSVEGDRSRTVPVHAIAKGRIANISNGWGGIVIEHSNNGEIYYSQYGHIRHLDEDFERGDLIEKGNQVGYISQVGMTCADGALHCEHLHFEIRRSDSFHPDPEDADYYTDLGVRRDVFKAYESPLAFVRSYQNPYQLTIIVEDSVTYPGISGDIKNNKVVIDEDVIKERFFKADNLEEWSISTLGEGCKTYDIPCPKNSGFGGNYHYAKTIVGPQETSAGKWFFDIPEGGYYSVYASIPIGHANTKNAKYQISHNGRIDYKTVNQAEIEGPLENRWVRLGTYDFAEGNNHYVKLNNNTGETVDKDGDKIYIAFDAIKLIKVYSNLPIVYSVSPSTAIKQQDTIFTVIGQNLDLVELEFSLANCDGITEVGSENNPMLRAFKCTPSAIIGQYSGAIKAGGSILKEFSVKVTDPPVPTLQKITVQPKSEEDRILYEGGQAYYEAVGTFSDGTESVITDRCTWWTSQSQYATSLGNGLVEALLESAGNEVRITAVYSDDAISISGTYETLVMKRPVIVRSISPTTATLGVTTNFTIIGENLPSTLEFLLTDCTGVQSLEGSSTAMRFSCTPRTSGQKKGKLTEKPDGVLLKEFTVDVSEEPAASPVVYSVAPPKAMLDKTTIFTVSGDNLSSTLAFVLNDCAGVELLEVSSATMLFSCTPRTIGQKEGEIRQTDGTVLKTFTVDVIEDEEEPAASPVVYSVTPTEPTEEAKLEVKTTFTVKGKGLPDDLEFLLTDCIGVVRVSGGSSTARQFKCTPRTSGQKYGRIEQASGAVLWTFTVDVL